MTEGALVNSEGAGIARRSAAYGTVGYTIPSWKLMPHFTYSTEFEPDATLIDSHTKSMIMGVNYRPKDFLMLKLEYQVVDTMQGSTTTATNNVASLGLEFVF